MFVAVLAKLLKLEKEFATIDAAKHPKMLVVCEDTSVTPLVEDFLKAQGLNGDEILRVDSNRKGELPEAEWADLREKLFDIDVLLCIIRPSMYSLDYLCISFILRPSCYP